MLANFNLTYASALVKTTGHDFLPRKWKTDPEFPPCWDWDLAFGYSQADIVQTWQEHILSSDRFWRRLDPLPYAKNTVRNLNRLAREGNDVYFLTDRVGIKAKQQTESWLYVLGMQNPTVILVSNKLPILQTLGVEFFIDDRGDTVSLVHDMASTTTLDLKVFLKDAPYNRMYEGLRRIGSAKEALEEVGLWRDIG